MVTRPEHQAAALADPLRTLGATVRIEPVIEILPPDDWADLDRAIKNIAEGRVSTLVFVSVNGVRVFLDRMAETGKSADLAGVRVIGIGRATCDALFKRGISARVVPGKSDSNSVADFLIQQQAEEPILVVRADRGSDVLAQRLTDANIQFRQVEAYRSVDRQTVSDDSMRAINAGEVDWLTVTSSAIAGSLVQIFGDALKNVKLVSISPTTSHALRELGYTPAAEAAEYNMPGVIEAVVTYEGQN